MNSIYKKQDIVTTVEVSQIVTIHYFEFHKSFCFCGESHDFWEIVYVDKGEIIVTSGTDDVKMEQGEMIFHKPNEYHNLRANGLVAPNIFIVTFVCNSDSMKYFEYKKLKLPTKLKSYIFHIIEEGRKAYDISLSDPYMYEMRTKEDAPIGAQQLIKLYIEQLLIGILREGVKIQVTTNLIPDKETIDNGIVSAIIDYMEYHIEENLTISEVCNQVNYGKTNVCTIFNKNTGYTIMQYFTALKIKKAKQLMRETEKNFTEISNQLSFSNPQYFYRIFKKVTGMTAKEYRNSLKIT